MLARGLGNRHAVDVILAGGVIIRYAILGPVELCDGERRMALGGPRQVTLLALLLMHANRAVSSDQLIDALWGPQSLASALKSLHVAISRLRKTLEIAGIGGESVLHTVTGGYLLAVKSGELDAEVFETRMLDGRRAVEAGDIGLRRRIRPHQAALGPSASSRRRTRRRDRRPLDPGRRCRRRQALLRDDRAERRPAPASRHGRPRPVQGSIVWLLIAGSLRRRRCGPHLGVRFGQVSARSGHV
jgi:DNA-binding winged helix-turn-helix (wHTH) protein